MTREEILQSLTQAREDKRLTLYLGAGVSVLNGLPNWEELVISMYIDVISERGRVGGWRPLPNYLYAIAQWHLDRRHEPSEITARKLRMYYDDEEEFLRDLRTVLYAGFSYDYSARFEELQRDSIRDANGTLDAVSALCEAGGIDAVITYNYDCLLEIALGTLPFQSVWRMDKLKPEVLPIYHVHGYVPMDETYGSKPEEIVFTEEQYHRAQGNAYFWSNLVQLKHMAGSVGLMVGLSLEDRNMRRLLDATAKLPAGARNYVLLQEPSWKRPDDPELGRIHENAQDLMDKINRSGGGMPGVKGDSYRDQIAGILGAVEAKDKEQQTFVLRELGIEPIWYREHEEVPQILGEILAG